MSDMQEIKEGRLDTSFGETFLKDIILPEIMKKFRLGTNIEIEVPERYKLIRSKGELPDSDKVKVFYNGKSAKRIIGEITYSLGWFIDRTPDNIKFVNNKITMIDFRRQR